MVMKLNIQELRHVSHAVEQYIHYTQLGIKDNYTHNEHSDTHVLEKNLGELNDLQEKILNKIKGEK
tara:strand:+ start:313 stop:510 length:198 start_codon:yes stop_codon:yes gene_type:complete